MKTEVINIRLSLERKREIINRSKKLGVSISTYLLLCENYVNSKSDIDKAQLKLF